MALVGGQVGRTNKRRRNRLSHSSLFLSIGSFRGFERRKYKRGTRREGGGVVVGAELVRVGEWERGGKKATRSSRHQNGAVCFFDPAFYFFFRFYPTIRFSCFDFFITKFLGNLLKIAALRLIKNSVECQNCQLRHNVEAFNVQTWGKEKEKILWSN